MAYKDILPKAFPYYVVVPSGHIDSELLELFGPREKFQTGSSFAVTIDARPGYVKLWMSDSSYITWKERQDLIEQRKQEEAKWRADRQTKIEAEWGPMLP